MSTSTETDQEKVTVTVQTDVVPTFNLSYPKEPDETDEEARERALDLAEHDASIALSQSAHEYEWQETDLKKEDRIGTLVIDETAGVNDIESMIDMGLESAPGVELVSNENGTYSILDTGRTDE